MGESPEKPLVNLLEKFPQDFFGETPGAIFEGSSEAIPEGISEVIPERMSGKFFGGIAGRNSVEFFK